MTNKQVEYYLMARLEIQSEYCILLQDIRSLEQEKTAHMEKYPGFKAEKGRATEISDPTFQAVLLSIEKYDKKIARVKADIQEHYEEAIQLYKAMCDIPPSDRYILMLAYTKNMKKSKIAEKVKMSEAWVSKKISRAIHHLANKVIIM